MNKYHQMSGPPKKPGLVAREQQVAHLQSEARQFVVEAGGMPMTGNMSLKQQLQVARSGLKRQRKQAGY